MYDTLLFDADSTRYSAGFVVDHHRYYVPGREEPFEKYTDATAYRKDQFEIPSKVEIRKEWHYTEPLVNCLYILKEGIERVLDTVPHKRHLILTTKGKNFRHDLASIREYKAKRSPKPPYHKEMVDYMDTRWSACSAPGLEADDLCSLLQTPENVIVSIDKDLLTVPGTHWNYKKDTWNEMTEIEALRKFYTQMLEGDATDNIQGLPYCAKTTIEQFKLKGAAAKGCGKVSAQKLLEDCNTEMDMFSRVLDVWMDYNRQDSDTIEDFNVRQDTEVCMLETGRLLHMTRDLHDDGSPVLWEFPSDV
jgi:hypothetical protein